MKKLILIILVIMTFTGCSKTVYKYDYNNAISHSGDWTVMNGRISVSEGEDLVKFKVKYLGDMLIEEGNTWTCEVLICKNDKESSIDNAEVIFNRSDINAKEITKDDTKVVSTDSDVININDYDLGTVYLKIKYTKNNEILEDIIELTVQN